MECDSAHIIARGWIQTDSANKWLATIFRFATKLNHSCANNSPKLFVLFVGLPLFFCRLVSSCFRSAFKHLCSLLGYIAHNYYIPFQLVLLVMAFSFFHPISSIKPTSLAGFQVWPIQQMLWRILFSISKWNNSSGVCSLFLSNEDNNQM